MNNELLLIVLHHAQGKWLLRPQGYSNCRQAGVITTAAATAAAASQDLTIGAASFLIWLASSSVRKL
jgi:UPF0716 family protein affecting phage T7 exclusion